jgi:hypothetical protein
MNGYFNLTYDFTNNQKWVEIALKTKSKLQDVQIMAIEIMTIAYSSLNRNEFKYEYLGVCCFKYNLSKVRVKKIFQEFLNCNFISKKKENIFYLTDYLIYQSNIKNYQNRTQESQEISKEDKRKQQIREAQARFRSNQKVINSNQIVIIDNQVSNQSVIKNNQDLYIYQREQEQDKEQEIKEKKINKKESEQADEPSFSFSENNFEGKEIVKSANCNYSEIPKGSTTTQNLQSGKPTSSSTRDKSSQLESDFNRLWEIYPKKEGKEDAKNKFKSAIKSNSCDEIIAGASRYVSFIQSEHKKCEKANNDFRQAYMGLSRFLGKKCFLDEWKTEKQIKDEKYEKEKKIKNVFKDVFERYLEFGLNTGLPVCQEMLIAVKDKLLKGYWLILEQDYPTPNEKENLYEFKAFLDDFYERREEGKMINFPLVKDGKKLSCVG